MRCCIALLVGLIGVPASAAVIIVPDDHATIAQALLAANPGDEILVRPGIHILKQNGIGAPGAVRLASMGGPEVTTLDTEDGDLFTISRDFLLEGFTIIGDSPVTTSPTVTIANDSGDVVIRNCVFITIGRTALKILWRGTPLIDRCVFRNGTGVLGGAVTIGSDSQHTPMTAVFINCLFHNNTASVAGGAIYIAGSNPLFINCTFADNSAGVIGGAIYVKNFSLPIVQNCNFWNNSNSLGHLDDIVESQSFTTVVSSNLFNWMGDITKTSG